MMMTKKQYRSDYEIPCYVIASDGFRESVSYQDDWCYGKSEHIGTVSGEENPRDLIKADIRRHFQERNRLPLYYVSDHGNMSRVRRVTLRRTA